MHAVCTQETLVGAEADMEAVLFEKGRLLSQWRASLAALAKRDEALQVITRAVIAGIHK